MDDRGVTQVVCAGDIAGFGPRPNECISMLMARGVLAVMGNSDYDLLLPQESAAPSSKRAYEIAEIEAWVRGQLSEESPSYLRGIPHCVEIQGGILVVHGAPGDMRRIVRPQDIPPIPDGFKVVLAGHLHVPFVIRHEDGLWVNVGSAGRPCDRDPRPAVSLLTERDGEWVVSQHRVDFDPQISARDIMESGMPFAANVASAVLEARWY